jgi:UDP-N-acetyl-D-galactosamine dehydrogenase
MDETGRHGIAGSSKDGRANLTLDHETIAIIGLGYVGLPLAVALGTKREVIGFDVNVERITELKCDHDATLEVPKADLKRATKLSFSNSPDDLKARGVFIVTVPTPIDSARRPDLTAIKAASRTVGGAMRQGAVVVYESTVYPGCTEEVCVPILEEMSGLSFNRDFFVGYSPERINPGDKKHRLETITKVTSGSTPEAAEAIDRLYASIITAGTHKTSSIKVAEAAKVIENTQRDLNIALMNELALIFHRLGIDTHEVLEAARTKWNFLPFTPGLVGGHCIGVDPYYLTHKAQEVGYHPDVILAGRRINDGMGYYVAHDVIQIMLKRKMHIAGSRILVLGLTFKENCPDLRNTKVIDVIRTLENYHVNVDVYDPWIDIKEARNEFGIDCLENVPPTQAYDAVIVAVGHHQFVKAGAAGARAYGKQGSVLYDVKGLFDKADSDGRL